MIRIEIFPQIDRSLRMPRLTSKEHDLLNCEVRKADDGRHGLEIVCKKEELVGKSIRAVLEPGTTEAVEIDEAGRAFIFLSEGMIMPEDDLFTASDKYARILLEIT